MNQKGTLTVSWLGGKLRCRGVVDNHTQALDSQVLKAEHQRVVQRARGRGPARFTANRPTTRVETGSTLLALSMTRHTIPARLAESSGNGTVEAPPDLPAGDAVSGSPLGQDWTAATATAGQSGERQGYAAIVALSCCGPCSGPGGSAVHAGGAGAGPARRPGYHSRIDENDF